MFNISVWLKKYWNNYITKAGRQPTFWGVSNVNLHISLSLCFLYALMLPNGKCVILQDGILYSDCCIADYITWNLSAATIQCQLESIKQICSSINVQSPRLHWVMGMTSGNIIYGIHNVLFPTLNYLFIPLFLLFFFKPHLNYLFIYFQSSWKKNESVKQTYTLFDVLDVSLKDLSGTYRLSLLQWRKLFLFYCLPKILFAVPTHIKTEWETNYLNWQYYCKMEAHISMELS